MKLLPQAESRYFKQTYPGGQSIAGVEFIDLRRFADDGGSMTELARLTSGNCQDIAGFELRQINFSELVEGAIKAFHVHREQTDVWFVPPADRILLILIDVREGSPTAGNIIRRVIGDQRSCLVRVPPGVAHGCRNLGPGTGHIIYFTDRHFDPDPERGDEGRLPWDYAGADIWELRRE